MSTPGKKLKYTFRRIPLFFFYVMRRIGIRILPLLLVREDIKISGMESGPFHLGFEGPESIDEILPMEPGSSRTEISQWFKEGKLCYGVRDGDRLIGKMWCDTEGYHYPFDDRPLETGGVYLFAAWVLDEYRGQNVAVLMRSRCCEALKELGFTRFYSRTFYFNRPARRFKEKLGCKNESLELHVNLFGKWARTWTLKRYS